MLNKITIIISELWRLKRRHYSKDRDGSEEIFVDSLAAFIADFHSKKTGYNPPESSYIENYIYKATHYNENAFKNIQLLSRLNGNVNFKHCLNSVLDQFFKDYPDLEKIKIPEYKYKKSK